MKTKIPSPVLARIQLMFQSGATLDEVANALDLDTTWQQPTAEAPRPTAVQMVAPAPIAQPANDLHMPRVDELTKHMESHVSSLLERPDVRDIPAVAGSLDAIYQHVVAIRKEINSPNTSIVKKAAPVAKTLPAKKNALEKTQKAAAPTVPPPMKVQPPVKKAVKEKLKPTGELPTAGKRRDVAHPFAASLSDKSVPIQTMSTPAHAQAKVQASTSRPMDAYRDRIAMAMNQISTIADEHDRDEDYIAVRHS